MPRAAGWVVTLASLQGLVRSRGVFLRTPKAGRASLVRALRSTLIETTLGVACWSLGLVLAASTAAQAFASPAPRSGGAQALAGIIGFSWWTLGTSAGVLSVLAFLQGATYLAAPVLCLLSLRSEKTAREVRRRALDNGSGEGVVEQRLLVGVGSLVGVLVALVIGAIIFPQAGAPLGSNGQQVITNLVGNPQAGATSIATLTPGGPTPTPSVGSTPTPAPGASPTGTGTATQTPTATPRPGASPTPKATVTPPRPDPTPHH